MNKVLNISEAASLAIHAMVCIAKDKDIIYTTPLLANKLKASVHHLSKVLQRLNKTGLVYSNRGRNGGFMINQEEKSIFLLDIYESIDGKFNQDVCIMHHSLCQGNNCIMGETNKKIVDIFFKYLSETSLEMLVNNTGLMK